ncbi:MAG TPA: hypothetical protein VMA37_09115 [Acetobacteraceae bacterium]|nr:hypothetical protein [Acetobacteraceae bacterium]
MAQDAPHDNHWPFGARAAPSSAAPDSAARPAPSCGPGSGRSIALTGHILASLRDDRGNFDGFVLETSDGTERCFETRNAELVAIILRAWHERRSICVVVDPVSPRRPVSVILEQEGL